MGTVGINKLSMKRILLMSVLFLFVTSAFAVNSYQQKVNPKFKIGVVEVDRRELILKAERNLEPYLEYTEWSSKKKEAFRNAYGTIIQGINNGNINERNLQRKWVDLSGNVKNTEGKGFDANGAVANFLNGVADALIQQGSYE